MLRQYRPELGEVQQFETTARYNAFISKWAVRTDKELKGRGIKFFEKSQTGKNVYYCTQKAFEKLCESIDIDQELLFD